MKITLGKFFFPSPGLGKFGKKNPNIRNRLGKVFFSRLGLGKYGEQKISEPFFIKNRSGKDFF